MTHILHQIDHAIELLDDAYPSVDQSIRETLERAQVEITSLRAEKADLLRWKEALIDEGVTTWSLTDKNSNDPRSLIHACIMWKVNVALDPAVSEAACKLRDTYLPEITRLRALTTPQPIETAPFTIDTATGERWLEPCYLFHTDWHFPIVGLCSGGVWVGRTDEGEYWDLHKAPTGWAPIVLGFWTQEELDLAKVKAEELSRALTPEDPK